MFVSATGHLPKTQVTLKFLERRSIIRIVNCLRVLLTTVAPKFVALPTSTRVHNLRFLVVKSLSEKVPPPQMAV